MEKRVTFNERWLPYLLVAPQIIITLVFFFWPSGQAIWQSLLVEDAFGGNSKFVWFDNFLQLFGDPAYYASVRVTVVFSALVASIGLALSLLLAVMADRVIRGATFYKTFLIWPYAVAPAVAGVLWGFMFNPSVGVVSWLLQGLGIVGMRETKRTGQDGYPIALIGAIIGGLAVAGWVVYLLLSIGIYASGWQWAP
jgi:sn-glycerol 3-phosphate transport system permease protein